MPCHFVSRSPVARSRVLVALAAATVAVGLSACSGTSTGGAGNQNPVGASTNQPVPGSVPQLGTTTVAGVTVGGTTLRKDGSGIAVLATVTSDHPDRLVSITSNYTTPTTLPQPLAVLQGATTTIDQTTALLQPAGPIDNGATVEVSFRFATAGIVQVYATYHS